MGIKDLLRFLKPYVHPIHINKYAGKRVGIDAYSWLHKGAYSCSMELCLNTEGDKRFQYINYCMHRINMLRHHNITPVLVFDGANIPSKALTEQQRHSKRKESLQLAMAKLEEGDINAATEMFQRAVSITPSMAHKLIQILRSENIEYVVAPYEADAQLAYLSSLDPDKGGIAAVISEDSDLLAYGCSSVIFKMDRYGNGEEIAIDNVFNSAGVVPSFLHFDNDLFTGMCVLAGCDFLPSVPGIGIGRAHALVSKYRNLDRVLSVLKYEKGNQMPKDYLTSFKEAIGVFQHARIYDADSQSLKHLTPLRETLLHYSGQELDFLGPELSSSQASAIAKGQLDPCSMKEFTELPSCNAQLVALTNPSQRSQRTQQTQQTQPSNRNSKQETTTDAGCFTIVTSHTTGIKKITKAKPNSSLCLSQLISPTHNNSLNTAKRSSASSLSLSSSSSVVPNNNPFKRQKKTTMLNECATEVTQVEDQEMLCMTQDLHKGKSVKEIGQRKRVISESNKNTIFNYFPGSA